MNRRTGSAPAILRTLAPAWDALLDLVYPPRCGGCDRRGTWFCAGCRGSIQRVDPGLIIPPGLAGIVSSGAFTGPLRTAIHNLKYNSDTPLARPLATLLAGSFDELPASWPLEATPVLVPVPLHRSKQQARGYNQAALIARELAELRGWEVDTRLVRARATGSQVGLTADRRKVNVAGAFQWRGGTVPPVVILVDDVCTTGATLSECAAAIRSAGECRVYAATVARAVFDERPEEADK